MRATGVGSMPGTDIDEAARVVVGEVPTLPHLPELPARGVGADLVGRGASLLAGIPVEVYGGRWQVARLPGREQRAARRWLAEDLLGFSLAASGGAGPIKIQATGPWTLSATLRSSRGHLLLADPAAQRDVAAALGEGIREHCAEAVTLIPGRRLVVQIDEPMLAAVVAGTLPRASGMGRLPPVPGPEVAEVLRATVEMIRGLSPAGGSPDAETPLVVLHTCAADPPLGVLAGVGLAGVSVDLRLLGAARLPALEGLLSEGADLWAGVVPSTAPASVSGAAPGPGHEALVQAGEATVRKLWHLLGWAEIDAVVRTLVTPTCGLAGASPAYARQALAAAHAIGEGLASRA
jgi:hypothetical protein